MRIRTSLLYILFSLLLLIIVGALLYPFLKIDAALKNIILSRLPSEFAANVHLQTIHLGFTNLELSGLDVYSPKNDWSLNIPRAQFEFNLLDLLRSRFDIAASLRKIRIQNPTFTLVMTNQETTNDGGSPAGSQFTWALIDRLPDSFWGKTLMVQNGTFRLASEEKKTPGILTRLQGNFVTTKDRHVSGRLETRGRSDSEATGVLNISLAADERTLDGSLQGSVGDLLLPIGTASNSSDSLSVLLEDLKFDLQLSADADHSSLDGEFYLSRFFFYTQNELLAQSQPAQATIRNWKLQLPALRFNALTASWIITGQIADLRHPSLDFNIQGHSDNCSEIGRYFPDDPRLKPAGAADLRMDVRGDIRSPQIFFEGDLDLLETPWANLKKIRFDGEFADCRLIINSLQASHQNGGFRLNGQILTAGAQSWLQADIQWSGALPGWKYPRQAVLSGSIFGAGGRFRTDLVLSDSAALDPHITLSAEYSHPMKSLEARLSANDENAWIILHADYNDRKPNYRLTFENAQKLSSFLFPWEGCNFIRDIESAGSISGDLKRFHYNSRLSYPKTSSSVALEGDFKLEDGGSFVLESTVQLRREENEPLDGSIRLIRDEDLLILESFILEDAIFASGMVNLKTGEIEPTEIRIIKFPLTRGLQFVSRDVSETVGAVLDGRIEVIGTIAKPGVSINVYASRGFIFDQRNLWAVITAQLEAGVLTIEECSIGSDVTKLLKLSGMADLNSDEIQIHADSHGADISSLLEVVGGNPVKLRGPLSLDANLAGRIPYPELDATLEVMSGFIYRIPFESLRALVHLPAGENASLQLTELELRQSSDLQMTGAGILPFHRHPLDLKFSAKGNLLKIPHVIEPDIQESRGNGEAEFVLSQDSDGLRIKRASLTIHDGSMRFPEVVSEITGINAQISAQDRRVRIALIEGAVEGQKFRISNTFDPEEEGQQLEHLYFPQIDLDFGVIEFESFGKGIHAHIPELMIRGSKGFIRLRGRNGVEKFLVSGPVTKPYFSGTVELTGSAITYPFPPGSGKPPSKFVRLILRILNSARWNLNILPERDNHYVREIKPVEKNTLIGNVSDLIASVDVDLTVDSRDSRLNLLGSLDEGDFRFQGNLVSTRGSVEYLDLEFRVSRFIVEFDEHDPLPWVQGSASTVYMDSLGVNRNIYLTLYVVDPTTKERQQRGRWGDFIFVLEDDIGSSQEQILAALGYSPEAFSEKVTSLGGTILSNALLRGLVRPIERRLENVLQLDMVRFQSYFAQHVFESQILGLVPGADSQIGWGAYLLRQSQLTVGKYVTDDAFISYTGLLETGINAENERHYGFLHRWNLDYRIRPISGNFVLSLRYEYDSLEQLEDKQVLLRYSFLF